MRNSIFVNSDWLYSAVSDYCNSFRVVEQSERFTKASKNGNLIPLYQTIFSDHLTPVLAYRCLVKEDDRDAPSFLFESVEPGLRNSSIVCTLNIFGHMYIYFFKHRSSTFCDLDLVGAVQCDWSSADNRNNCEREYGNDTRSRSWEKDRRDRGGPDDCSSEDNGRMDTSACR